MKNFSDQFYLSPDRLRGSFNPVNASRTVSAALDFKENQPSPGLFSRDLLLFKCKATIEELQNELDETQKEKSSLEDKLIKLEKETLEKTDQISQERFQKEKIEQELKENRLSFMSLNEKTVYLEDKLRLYKENDARNEEMKRNFQGLIDENEGLKGYIDELEQQVRNKEELTKEWQEVLENIKKKITVLEDENQDLKTDLETALANNEELHKINEEKEHLKKINEKLDRVNLEFKQETDKKSLNINELTNENLSLKNALNKAKNQIDLLENQHKLNLAEQEQSFRAKMHETESLWSDKQKKEMELFKTDLMISFEKLKQEKQELEEEIYKISSEKQECLEEIQSLNENFEAADQEIKRLQDKNMQDFEEMDLKQKEEIRKFQKYLEEKTGVIHSLEKKMQKFEDVHSRVLNEFEIKKDELSETLGKNEYLSKKIQECQNEITKMKDELRKTLENEDQRTELLHKKIREFEQIIAERDIQLQSKEKTFTKTVHKAKKLKKENKEILKHLNLIKEEYDNSLRVNELLKVENSQFKDNQLDFQSILNDKIDQITKEMKVEREKRLDEQNYARELEEKIMLLESQYKNEIGYLKIELSRKDKDFKFRKQDEYNSVKNNYNNNNSILQNIESDKESFSEKKKKEKPEKDIKEIKNEIEKFERKVVRDSERLNNTYRNNGELGESHQFIDKFKKVIDKLENRLEKMSSDIKVNNKNKNNISYELYDK